MTEKKAKVGLKGIKEVLEDFAKAGKIIEKGGVVKKEIGIYFENIEAFRKALTPKRLELIHLIKEHNPKSIQELAKIAKRDIKNVADDIKLLSALGLVETKRKVKGRREVASYVDYNVIELKIAV